VPACGPAAQLAERGIEMLPLSDGIPARWFPIVNVLLIVANFAVFISYELPRRKRRSRMRIGAGSGIVSLVINYQQ
jgi:hypothetical protein